MRNLTVIIYRGDLEEEEEKPETLRKSIFFNCQREHKPGLQKVSDFLAPKTIPAPKIHQQNADFGNYSSAETPLITRTRTLHLDYSMQEK